MEGSDQSVRNDDELDTPLEDDSDVIDITHIQKGEVPTAAPESPERRMLKQLSEDRKKIAGHALRILQFPEGRYFLQQNMQGRASVELGVLWIDKGDGFYSLKELCKEHILRCLMHGIPIVFADLPVYAPALLKEAVKYNLSINEDALADAFLLALSELSHANFLKEEPAESLA